MEQGILPQALAVVLSALQRFALSRLSASLAIWQITGLNSDFLSLFLYPSIGRDPSLQSEVTSIDSGYCLPSEIELHCKNHQQDSARVSNKRRIKVGNNQLEPWKG